MNFDDAQKAPHMKCLQSGSEVFGELAFATNTASYHRIQSVDHVE